MDFFSHSLILFFPERQRKAFWPRPGRCYGLVTKVRLVTNDGVRLHSPTQPSLLHQFHSNLGWYQNAEDCHYSPLDYSVISSLSPFTFFEIFSQDDKNCAFVITFLVWKTKNPALRKECVHGIWESYHTHTHTHTNTDKGKEQVVVF